VQHPSGVTFDVIEASERHTCAIDTTGQSWCWGYGAEGALGGGFTFGDSIPAAVTHPSGVTFTSISSQYRHVCALDTTGQAWCWGKNPNGQLGDNTLTTRYTPVAVQQPGGVTFASLQVGWSQSCGVTSGGQSYCWGQNNRGQLGDASFTQRKVPVAVSQPSGVAFGIVSPGGYHTCGVDGVGQSWCWGRNDFSQIGNGGTTDSNVPLAVSH
jgi:alpha-tubulin suppressor-like RCC1 family protein